MSKTNSQVIAIDANEGEDLAAQFQLHRSPLCATLTGRYAERLHSGAELGEQTRTSLDRSIREALLAQLAGLHRPAQALPECCPDFAVQGVRSVLALGRLDLLLCGYRVAHEVLWEAWFALVDDSPQLTAAGRRALLQSGSDFFFSYEALLSDFATTEFQARLERAAGSGDQRRFQAVRALLEGTSLAAGSLDFELQRNHLALVAWGAEPKAAARALAAHLGRPAFIVSPLEREPTCWAWLSGANPLTPEQDFRVREFRCPGARIALGLEGSGAEGFRASHRQALRSRRFATELGPDIVRFEDVAVEALAAENRDDARAFVAHELRGIDDDSTASRRIRETIAAYFAAEHNAACAGAALGVHQQTVANRLRAAEERLGHTSIGVRRTELEMALRLRAFLATEQ